MNRKLLAVMFVWSVTIPAARADDDPPLALTRDGFFYVGGHATMVSGHSYVVGQMYVEMRIPAKQTRPYPIIMVHGGTRTGTPIPALRTGGRAGRSISRGAATPSTWWTSRDADAPAMRSLCSPA